MKTNREFGVAKIERKMQRDKKVKTELKCLSYKIIPFRKREIKNELE